MNGPTTTLTPPAPSGKNNTAISNTNAPRTFTFDHSYWTHDGFDTDATGKTTPKPGSNYADQVY